MFHCRQSSCLQVPHGLHWLLPRSHPRTCLCTFLQKNVHRLTEKIFSLDFNIVSSRIHRNRVCQIVSAAVGLEAGVPGHAEHGAGVPAGLPVPQPRAEVGQPPLLLAALPGLAARPLAGPGAGTRAARALVPPPHPRAPGAGAAPLRPLLPPHPHRGQGGRGGLHQVFHLPAGPPGGRQLSLRFEN